MTFLEGHTQVINLAIDGLASTEATRDILLFLCSWKFELESLSLGKDSWSLSDISKCVFQNLSLKWLNISVRN